jgi:hypothetical protein
MENYEAPELTELGSIAEVTRGGDPDALGDGAAFRGPVASS